MFGTLLLLFQMGPQTKHINESFDFGAKKGVMLRGILPGPCQAFLMLSCRELVARRFGCVVVGYRFKNTCFLVSVGFHQLVFDLQTESLKLGWDERG
jgi:hypothetical protein